MTDNVPDIIEELKQVGALIPEKEWSEDCVDPAMMLFDSIAESRTLAHAFLSSPSEEVKNWDIARINGQRQLINSLEGEGFLPVGTRDMLEDNLSRALDALEKKDYLTAASSIQAFGINVEKYLPQWISQCSCVKKGDITAGIYQAIDKRPVSGFASIDEPTKKVLWEDMVFALYKQKVLTEDEIKRLIKEVRW